MIRIPNIGYFRSLESEVGCLEDRSQEESEVLTFDEGDRQEVLEDRSRESEESKILTSTKEIVSEMIRGERTKKLKTADG